jgi:hypothetical protein
MATARTGDESMLIHYPALHTLPVLSSYTHGNIKADSIFKVQLYYAMYEVTIGDMVCMERSRISRKED